MVWYRDSRIQTSALAVLAVIASQVLQIILYLVTAMILQESSGMNPMMSSLITLLPAILATLAGGAFIGRLRPENSAYCWLVTAFIAGFLPIGLQLVIDSSPRVWLTDSSVWMSAAGSILLWIIGCFMGRLSHIRNPDPGFNRNLVRWTGGITAMVVLLYLFTWGSMVFSKSYRLAKTVDLQLPPDVEESPPSFLEPGIARSRHFSVLLPSGDTRIQEFYLDTMMSRGWSDITRQFQSWPVEEWQFRTDTQRDRIHEYALAGGHWLDLSGKVAVSLILQAEKVDENKTWEETDWRVRGLILSRPYSEPPVDTSAQMDSAVPEKTDISDVSKTPNGTDISIDGEVNESTMNRSDDLKSMADSTITGEITP